MYLDKIRIESGSLSHPLRSYPPILVSLNDDNQPHDSILQKNKARFDRE